MTGNSDPVKVETIDKLLLAAVLFFTLLLVAISKWSPNDGQTFQVISGLLTGFAGAFFARLKTTADKKTPPENTTATATAQDGRA